MDPFIATMLNELNQKSLIEIFQSQNIDKDVLLSLTTEEMKELLPNIGIRKKISQYIENKKNLIITSPTILIENPSISNSSKVEMEGLTYTFVDQPHGSSSTPTSDLTFSTMATPKLQLDLDQSNLSMQSPLNDLPFTTMATPKNQSDLELRNLPTLSYLSTEDQEIEVIDMKEKKMKITCHYFPNNMSLKSFLESSSIGRGIIHLYQREGKFSEKIRCDLCRLIIDAVLCARETLTSVIAESISEEIANLFPTENKACYYYSSIAKKKNSGGKLLDRYRNIRRKYTPKKETCMAEDSEKKVETQVDDNIIKKIQWLSSSDEPWAKVEQFWVDTFQERAKNRACPGFASSTTLKYLALRHNLGYTLIESDFEQLYPTINGGFLHNWDIASLVITSHLESHSIVLTRDSFPSDDDYMLAILKSLPRILPQPPRKAANKPMWRPSNQECAEAFVINVNNIAEQKADAAKRHQRYLDHGLTFQPMIYRVLHSGDSYYLLHFDDLVWKFRDLKKALDIAFKTYQVLNLSYPYELEMVWTFLQINLYGIETKYDRKSPKLSSLLKVLTFGRS